MRGKPKKYPPGFTMDVRKLLAVNEDWLTAAQVIDQLLKHPNWSWLDRTDCGARVSSTLTKLWSSGHLHKDDSNPYAYQYKISATGRAAIS